MVKIRSIRLAVIGSRSFTDKNRLYHEIDEIRKLHRVVQIVSGGAGGADKFAEEYADDRGIPKNIIPARWDDMSEPCLRKVNKYGKEYNALAGFNRNTDVIEACDAVIAFWDGRSTGTMDALEKAKNLKKGRRVVRF